ncbi:hypothetical protein HAX54_038135 [Datura stramonium]|uniref:Uncharacterized protein n=1 Tax=Datura stramonium TaxID=4076 RepID=A0ABS8SHV3_DATST|nr:hypothetical protein [Datura stramonium]
MEKGEGKRYNFDKNNNSDSADSNVYVGFSFGVSRYLEERMNHLAIQMSLEMSMKEKESLVETVTPSRENVDEEATEQYIEETLLKESLEAKLSNDIGESSGGLEGACHAIIGLGSSTKEA